MINKLIDKIPNPTFLNNKLGGVCCIVHIEETILNHKYKSHRGRTSPNKADALCIIEYKMKLKRVFATTIPNKKAQIILFMMKNQVMLGSIIHTNKNKVYNKLKKKGFLHGSVCRKYNFANEVIGMQTQAVEALIIS